MPNACATVRRTHPVCAMAACPDCTSGAVSFTQTLQKSNWGCDCAHRTRQIASPAITPPGDLRRSRCQQPSAFRSDRRAHSAPRSDLGVHSTAGGLHLPAWRCGGWQELLQASAFCCAAMNLHAIQRTSRPCQQRNKLLFLCSRAYIRAAYCDDTLPVPSPTYLLQNIYDDLEGAPDGTNLRLISV